MNHFKIKVGSCFINIGTYVLTIIFEINRSFSYLPIIIIVIFFLLIFGMLFKNYSAVLLLLLAGLLLLKKLLIFGRV